MLNSKFFTVMIALTLVVVAAAVTFQVLEMSEYNLFETLMARFGVK